MDKKEFQKIKESSIKNIIENHKKLHTVMYESLKNINNIKNEEQDVDSLIESNNERLDKLLI